MTHKFVGFKCTLLTLMLASGTLARPNSLPTLSAGNVRQIQATLKEALPLYRTAASAHKEPGHGSNGKLSIVHLILIIGKVLAPLVGAIIEPLLVNVAKGITWAITYSLATGFDKPPNYEHFIPALEHYDGGDHGNGDGDDGGEYESHKPTSYELKELPTLALELTGVLSESSDQSEQTEAIENAESKLVGLLLKGKPPVGANLHNDRP